MRSYYKSLLYVKAFIIGVLLSVYFYNVDIVAMMSSILLSTVAVYGIALETKEVRNV